MIHVIGGLFDDHELAALAEAAAALPFEDGAKTSGVLARAVKRNAQAAPGAARDAVVAKVQKALLAHPGFVSVARPKGFARILVSRYGPSETYGTHVDDALIGGARTDVSFTVALTPPGEYRGGALVIEDGVEDRAFRLEAGEAIIYPSDTLHRVDPVQEGERLAVVGWVTSWVRDPARREVLSDLDQAVEAARTAGMARAEVLRLAKTRSNLLRMWAE